MPGSLSARQLFRSALLEYSDPSKCINLLFITSLYCLDIKFCRVVNAVFFLLGDPIACEFYVPTFRHTLFRLHRSCEQEIYSFFWVNPWLLNFMCRRFSTLFSFFIGRVKKKDMLTQPLKMEQIVQKRRHIKFRSQGFTQKKEYISCSQDL